MSWIRSYQALRDHPKTRKLARRVGGVPAAIGHLHCLWYWTLDYAPDGNLTKHDAEDIAIACEWDGEPEVIIGHLIECGFIDNGDGLRVHDWPEYGGATVAAREKDTQRKREARSKTSVGRPADTHRTAHVDREIDREIDRNSVRPVDNSTIHAGAVEDRKCWRCGKAIDGDDLLDDKCVLSRKGLRHVECAT